LIDAALTAFTSTFLAILDIFVVILAAGVLVRTKVIRQSHIDGLSVATVWVFLPCLMFANIVKTFDPSKFPFWWALPLASGAMVAVGLGLGALLFLRELPRKRNMLPLAAMANAGYLVLPVGLALYPKEFDTFALYTFLFILGYNPVLWSVGKYLSTARPDEAPRWSSLVTPPAVATLLAVGIVLFGARPLMPGVVLKGVSLMGSAAVPVATFVLGAVLGSIPIELRSNAGDAARVVLVKLILLPLLTLWVLHATGICGDNLLLRRFLLIEAAAAPATGIILQIRSYGGDETKVGSLMMVAYVVCLATLPLWLVVGDLLVAG
jgi:predicted permease